MAEQGRTPGRGAGHQACGGDWLCARLRCCSPGSLRVWPAKGGCVRPEQPLSDAQALPWDGSGERSCGGTCPEARPPSGLATLQQLLLGAKWVLKVSFTLANLPFYKVGLFVYF